MKSEEGRVKNLIVRRGREGKIGKAMQPSCTEPNPRGRRKWRGTNEERLTKREELNTHKD